jgi:hypothetical protein
MKGARMWRLAAVVASPAVLLAPMTASAALPTPSKALIVPFKSVGPVKLGTTKAAAFSKWGQAQCNVGTGGRDTCTWLSTSPSDFPEEGAVLELVNGKVCGILIRAGSNQNSSSLTVTRLKKWKTKEGVGLGSTMKAAKHVLGGKEIVRKHHVTTSFSPGFSPATAKKVEEMTIFKDGCNVT